jgi:hypothetical protein
MNKAKQAEGRIAASERRLKKGVDTLAGDMKNAMNVAGKMKK